MPSCSNIAINDTAAFASVHPDSERLRFDRAALRTGLARSARIDQLHSPTSVCSFVGDELDELIPCGVVDGQRRVVEVAERARHIRQLALLAAAVGNSRNFQESIITVPFCVSMYRRIRARRRQSPQSSCGSTVLGDESEGTGTPAIQNPTCATVEPVDDLRNAAALDPIRRTGERDPAVPQQRGSSSRALTAISASRILSLPSTGGVKTGRRYFGHHTNVMLAAKTPPQRFQHSVLPPYRTISPTDT